MIYDVSMEATGLEPMNKSSITPENTASNKIFDKKIDKLFSCYINRLIINSDNLSRFYQSVNPFGYC